MPNTAHLPNPTEPSTGRRAPMRRRLLIGTAAGGIAVGAAIGATGLAMAATTSPSSPGAPSASHASSAPVPGPGQNADRGGKGGKRGKGNDGTVTAVNGSAVTLRLRDASSRTYTLTSSTTYHRGPATANRSNLAVGEHLRVRLADPTASKPTATDIDIIAPHIDGTVTAISSDSITVTDPDGFTRTIRTTSTTTYTKGGTTSNRSGLSTGTAVHATGTVDADHTSLDARTIDVPSPR